uniref:Uncharacterized protein n=1 Tax=Romanomermis culicivorax TaxID=13658 RepID=A0A915KQ87_ROMCU
MPYQQANLLTADVTTINKYERHVLAQTFLICLDLLASVLTFFLVPTILSKFSGLSPHYTPYATLSLRLHRVTLGWASPAWRSAAWRKR